MSCFARACRRQEACAWHGMCEKTWHLCDPDTFYKPKGQCTTCGAKWTFDETDGKGTWFRDPMKVVYRKKK